MIKCSDPDCDGNVFRCIRDIDYIYFDEHEQVLGTSSTKDDHEIKGGKLVCTQCWKQTGRIKRLRKDISYEELLAGKGFAVLI